MRFYCTTAQKFCTLSTISGKNSVLALRAQVCDYIFGTHIAQKSERSVGHAMMTTRLLIEYHWGPLLRDARKVLVALRTLNKKRQALNGSGDERIEIAKAALGRAVTDYKKARLKTKRSDLPLFTCDDDGELLVKGLGKIS
jgi:hypothetical protein